MAVQDFVSFDFVILNFFQVKARTPLKRLMRSKGALKDQSRLIQHFSKELQTANFRFKHHGKIVRLALFTIVFFCENAEVNFSQLYFTRKRSQNSNESFARCAPRSEVAVSLSAVSAEEKL